MLFSKRTELRFLLIAGFLNFALCCGCKRNSLPRAPVIEVPVTGVVTLDGKPLDGKPLAGAAVVFTTQSMGAFTAATKEDGSYQLSTSYGGETVCKGLCRVTISRFVLPAGVQPQADTSPLLLGGKESLPAKYSNFELSQLTADVPEQGGKFDFSLTAQ